MKKMLVLAFSLSTITLSSGCFHAVIETASPAGSQTIDIPWAHGFLYGLVPPNVVDSAAQCPSGAAQVVTEHSFLNGLAMAITAGIYTPMHITVTCASGSAALDVPTVKNLAEAKAMLQAGETFILPLHVTQEKNME
jgi:Bor protein